MAKYAEFFRDMKRIPLEEDSPEEYEALVDEEIRKCTEGVVIITPHGTRLRLSGWLYFHLNHFNMLIDKENKFIEGKKDRISSLPLIRDNELIFNDALLEARKQGKGLIIVGSRRTGKTSMESSYILHSALLDYGSQNVIVGNSKKDIELITDPCSFALERMWSGLDMIHITKDWGSLVQFGYKNKNNDVFKYSQILIRNTSSGDNKEVLAGITPSSLVFDEIGKCDFAENLAAAKPAFTSATGGWRCIPILTGTGGDFEKPKDARDLFNAPISQNFLECVVPGETKKKGLFISGLYRHDCKIQSTIDGFIENEKDRKLFNPEPNIKLLEVKTNPVVMISDKEAARETIERELKEAMESNKPENYLKHKMYYPIHSDDCFLTKGVNPFSNFFEGLSRHKERLLTYGPKPQWVHLHRLGNTIGMTISNKIPIANFPYKEWEDIDAAIAVIDAPKYEGKYRMEIMGVDPYNQDQSASSPSLGSCYVIRQQNNDLSDPYQDTMVAWYTARPGKLTDFYQNVELLADWYNCTILHENSNAAFFQHFDEKKKGYMFIDTWRTQQEITKKTTIRSAKGLAPTKNNQDFLINLGVKYFEEPYEIDGELRQGYERILDPLLIDEIFRFKEENTDRVWGFLHALAHLYHNKKFIDSVVVVQPEREEVREVQPLKTVFLPATKSSPFISKRGPFLT